MSGNVQRWRIFRGADLQCVAVGFLVLPENTSRLSFVSLHDVVISVCNEQYQLIDYFSERESGFQCPVAPISAAALHLLLGSELGS